MKRSFIYTTVLPVILGTVGTAILYSYITPWSAAMTDSATYLRMAEEIQKGRWYIELWGRGAYSAVSLYSILAAGMEWFIPGFDVAGTWVSVIAVSAAVIPLFILTKRFYGGKAAWVVIPLSVLHPLYLHYTSIPLTEALFTLFFLSGIILTLYALTQDSIGLWFATGVVNGAAWMTRDAGVILPLLSFLWLVIYRWKDKPLFLNVLRRGMALFIGVILISVPLKLVIKMNQRDMSAPPPNVSIAVTLMASDLRDVQERERYFLGLTPDGREYAFNEVLKKAPGVMEVLGHWEWVLQRFGYNLVEFAKSFYSVLQNLILLPFILVGLFRGKGPARDSGGGPGSPLFLGSYVLVYLCFYLLAGGFTGAVGPERYLVPVIPILGIWAAAGILQIGEMTGRFDIRHLGKLVVFLCMSFILVTYFPAIRGMKQRGQDSLSTIEVYKELGGVLRGNFPSHPQSVKDLVIMERSPLLSYYAGASWVMTPYGEYHKIMKFAKYKGVDFMFIDKRTSKLRPQLSFLMSSQSPPIPGIERFYVRRSKKDPDDVVAVLYQIKE